MQTRQQQRPATQAPRQAAPAAKPQEQDGEDKTKGVSLLGELDIAAWDYDASAFFAKRAKPRG